MKIINLTVKPIKVFKDGKYVKTIPTSVDKENVPYSVRDEIKIYEVDGIPVYESVPLEIINLPEPKEDCLYVTTLAVAKTAAANGRRDVVFPSFIRNETGRIIGVDALLFMKI